MYITTRIKIIFDNNLKILPLTPRLLVNTIKIILMNDPIAKGSNIIIKRKNNIPDKPNNSYPSPDSNVSPSINQPSTPFKYTFEIFLNILLIITTIPLRFMDIIDDYQYSLSCLATCEQEERLI